MPAFTCDGQPVVADEREGRSPSTRRSRRAFSRRAIVGDLGNGEARVVRLRSRVRLAEVHEPLAVAIGQRLEQRAAQQREHRGVRADAQRQREHDRDAEARRAPQAAKREPQVADELLEPARAARVAHLLLSERDVRRARAARRSALRRAACRAGRSRRSAARGGTAARRRARARRGLAGRRTKAQRNAMRRTVDASCHTSLRRTTAVMAPARRSQLAVSIWSCFRPARVSE